MTYNLTFMENVTDFTAVVQGVNSSLGEGYLFTILLFFIGIIAIIAMWKYDLKVSMIPIGFGLTILAAIFWSVSLVPFWVVGALFGMLFLAIIVFFIWGE